MLVALYEEPEKPANALDFIKQVHLSLCSSCNVNRQSLFLSNSSSQFLGAPTSGEVEKMTSESEDLKKQAHIPAPHPSNTPPAS